MGGRLDLEMRRERVGGIEVYERSTLTVPDNRFYQLWSQGYDTRSGEGVKWLN